MADERHCRQITRAAFSPAEQRRIDSAVVAICGLGGLGAPVATYLAMAGVGEIIGVEDDCVELSNLNRQFIYGIDDVGRSKADVASDFLSARVAGRVSVIEDRLTGDAPLQTWFGRADLVVDCLDNMDSRNCVAEYCRRGGQPLVWGAVGGVNGYMGVGSTISDVFPDGASENAGRPAEVGVVGATCGIVGSAMAGLVLQILCGRYDGRPRTWRFDGRSLSFSSFLS